ncbi:acyltransferase family protein [Blastomonas sp. RAC04]|uniref:acyltransferase family protein n=1 Tax=Blastomonas sp. RAC04 TaxID=1842535 RepID=UPI00085659C9|nr:acyltransferase family protein [Blastomonas sp. RAC04]AOG01472.1 acyltransferase family protein [Blastomonas sp. RAC04]
MNYRPDIDGLRAIAVSTVVLFHPGVPFLSGGYVGVDVFFVISGYLITGIINKEIVSGTFSFRNFFERRIRRIFPALFFMLFVTTVMASIVMMPRDLMDYAKSLVATVLSGSNMLFWWQSGYFDGAAEAKPLLHTWSLAVEEQFYLAFPLILVLLQRFMPRRIQPVVVTAILLSFGLSVALMAISPTSSFYIAPLRAWELLIGAMLAFVGHARISNPLLRELLAGAGLVAILATAVLYTKLTTFPAQGAVLPVLGSASIILAGSTGTTLVGRLLALRPMVFVGLLSYSFYLWHWPALVLAEYVAIDELTTMQSAIAVGSALFMAYLSWRFVERPFRSKTGLIKTQKAVFVAAAATVMLSIGLSGAILVAQGLPLRFSPNVTRILVASESLTDRMATCSAQVEKQLDPKGGCVIGSNPQPTGFLMGDSHADAITGAVQAVAKAKGMSFYYGVDASCPPLLGVGTGTQCIANNRRWLDFIGKHPEIRTIIIASRWTSYTRGRAVDFGPAESNEQLPYLMLENGETVPRFSIQAKRAMQTGISGMVDALIKLGRDVVIVYPIPETGYNIPTTLARMVSQGRAPEKFTRPMRYYQQRQRSTFEILDSLPYGEHLKALHPEQILCDNGQCRVYSAGKVLYWDDDHLSLEGAMLLYPDLLDIIGSFPVR